VVVTNKDTAAGPDETVTLHYSLEEDGSNNNLFDEVAASETLLLLSESGERKQGILSIFFPETIKKPRNFFCCDLSFRS
jgi:hypothetical protein